MVEDIPLDLKVAVMGCVVNGPGEAKEADIGIAGGKGEGLLIKKGEVIRKMPEDQLLSVLREELLNWEKKSGVIGVDFIAKIYLWRCFPTLDLSDELQRTIWNVAAHRPGSHYNRDRDFMRIYSGK